MLGTVLGPVDTAVNKRTKVLVFCGLVFPVAQTGNKQVKNGVIIEIAKLIKVSFNK